jgi:dihydroflavonol-4-reductase
MIFVTGGTGLVGSHLLMKLLEEGYQPRAIYRNAESLSLFKKMERWYAKPSGFFDKIDWVEANITQEADLKEAMTGAETIFHCAALVSFQFGDQKKLELSNIFGTKTMVDLAIAVGAKNFFHISSTAAIGKPKDKSKLINEEIQWKKTKNASNYAISKYFAELEVWRGFEEGLQGAILNPSIVIGPGNWGKSSTSLIQSINNGLKFYTDGANGFVDARDVAKGIFLAFQKGINRERILLISENKSYYEIFSLMANALGKKPPTIKVGKFLSSIGWRILWLWRIISGKEVSVTKETAHSANSRNLYSNEKSKALLEMDYYSIEEAIKNTSKCFQNS